MARDPEAIAWGAMVINQAVETGTAEAAQVLDFTRPVAVIVLAILHFISDSDDPRGMVGRLLEAVPPGSYLAISTPQKTSPAITTPQGHAVTTSIRQCPADPSGRPVRQGRSGSGSSHRVFLGPLGVAPAPWG